MRVGALAPLGVGTVAWRGPEPRLTLVLCASFEMAPKGLEAIAPPPPPLGALPGDTGRELIHPDDYVPWKAEADVLIVGYAKSAAASEALPFSIRIGTIDKQGWATAGAATHEVPLSSTYLRDAPRDGAPIRVAPVEVDAPTWHRNRTVPEKDFSIFNVAPRDQRLPTIDPHMRMVLEGLLENTPIYDVDLPSWWPSAYLTSDVDEVASWRAVPLVADTLLADVDAERLTLTWRANLPRPAPDEVLIFGTADHPLAPEELEGRLGEAKWTTALSMDDEEEGPATQARPLDIDDEPTGQVELGTSGTFPSAPRDEEATGALDIESLRSMLDARAVPFSGATTGANPAPSWAELRTMAFEETPSSGGVRETEPPPSVEHTQELDPPTDVSGPGEVEPPEGHASSPPSLDDDDDLPTLHPPAPEVAPAVGRAVPVDELADAPPPPPPPPLPSDLARRPRTPPPIEVSPDAATAPGLGPPPPPPPPPEGKLPPPAPLSRPGAGPRRPPPRRRPLETAVLDEDAARAALPREDVGFGTSEETSSIDLHALQKMAATPFRPAAEGAPARGATEEVPSLSGDTVPPPGPRPRQDTAQIDLEDLGLDGALPFETGMRSIVRPPNPAAGPGPTPPNPAGRPVPPAQPVRRATEAEDAAPSFRLPTLDVEVHGRIRAGLLDGVSLDALLEREEVDERTWRLASRQLAIELAREAEDGGQVLSRGLDAAIAEARSRAPVGYDEDEGPPEDEMDLATYAAALAEVDEAEDPAEAVEALGFEPDQWVALRRRWTRRALQDRNLAMELRHELAAARRSLRRM